jgi:hypothetical protein
MAKPIPNPLSKRFLAEQNAYKRLRQQTEKLVVRWEHWSDFHWGWDPSDTLIQHMENASYWRRNPPKQTDKSQAYYSYGFDASDRIVAIRYGSPREARPGEEHFIRYSKAEFQVSVFYDGRLTNSATGTILDGKTVRIDQACPGEKAWKEIQWLEDRPVRVVFGEAGKKADLEWEFTKAGKLVGMYDLPRKLPKGTNLATLKKRIHKHLLTAIPKCIAKFRIRQPVYCLFLGYDSEGNGAMPPMLSIGMESERQLCLSKDPKKAKQLIWSPDELQHRLSKPRCLPTDKKFEKACELFNRLMDERGSEKPAIDLLNQVAKQLGAAKWSGKLPVTDDFVVLACDFEGCDLSENIRKSASLKALKSLKKQGLV